MTLFKKACLAATAIGLIAAPVAMADTLQDALAEAFRTNPQLEIQRFQADLADESLQQARSQGRTSVNLSGSAGVDYNDTNAPFAFNAGQQPLASAQLQAVRPLYTGGRIRAGIRQAEAGVDTAEAQFNSARQDLYLQVVTAYMDVLRDRETVAIRENNVAVTGEQVRAASDRFEVGVVTRTDVALSEARLEGARAALAGAEATLEGSLATYAFLTGMEADTLAPPPPVPTLPAGVEDAIQRGIDANPDILAARFSRDAAIEAIEVARAQKRPQLNAVGTASVQERWGDDPRRDTNLSAVAQGSIPIFQGGRLDSQIRSAMLQRNQASQQIATLERQIRAQVAQGWYGYQASLRAIEASKRQVDAADIAYEGAKQELSVGVRTTLDVLDQEQQLFEARLALVDAERDAYVAAHQLLRAVGALQDIPSDIPAAAVPATMVDDSIIPETDALTVTDPANIAE